MLKKGNLLHKRGLDDSQLYTTVAQNHQHRNEGASGGKGNEMLKCARCTNGQIKRKKLTDLKIEIAI